MMPQALSMEEILTHHHRKSTGVNDKIINCWIPFSCTSFRVLVLCMLTGTLEYNRAFLNIIINTCAFPTVTRKLKPKIDTIFL